MELPFTQAQFVDLFRAQNAELWWAWPILAMVGAALAVAAAGNRSHRVVMSGLALVWALVGLDYHLLRFTALNPAAWIFGALFLVQSLLFVLAGLRTQQQQPTNALSATRQVAAWGVISYGLVFYMVLGACLHDFAVVPRFGLTPCPTTIFTWGVLLLIRRPVPLWLIVIPTIWTAIGGSAAVLLQVPEDYGLIAAGAVAAPWLIVTGVRQRGRQSGGRVAGRASSAS